jgi:hypothetical protein
MKLVRAVVLLATVLLSVQARADILSAGSPLAFNLDFSAEPSWEALRVQFDWTPPLTGAQAISINVFDGPNATGNFLASATPPATSTIDFVFFAGGSFPDVLSVQLLLNSGTVDLTSLSFEIGLQGFDPNPVTGGPFFIPFEPPITRTVIVPTPEPGVLALLALAFASARWVRRWSGGNSSRRAV